MVGKISVTKYDGTKQTYDQEKVVNSLIRSGVVKEEVARILAEIETQLYDGIPTSKLYEIVNSSLDKSDFIRGPHLYRLREILAEMDSIDFEKFVQKILETEGYTCRWNTIIKGLCIEHQVDLIAQKEGKTYFVEVKHHTNFHRNCGLGMVVELWGRLDDLQNGFKKGLDKYDFAKTWLFSNTKFSEHAKKYAKAKDLILTGWRFSTLGSGLEKMVEKLREKEMGRLISINDFNNRRQMTED
ncbi:MAG: restriction endonuclease [bacterium]|nr:restriction endonuclease [bacterium]